jgi:hypothetical protein
MTVAKQDLGELISVHGISPMYLQRSLFIAVLSLIFFLTMMAGFYIRPSIGYFVLATAFLLVYLVTMISWVLLRRRQVGLYEKGLTYKGDSVLWENIRGIDENGEIITANGEKFVIPKSINNFGLVLNVIRTRVGSR